MRHLAVIEIPGASDNKRNKNKQYFSRFNFYFQTDKNATNANMRAFYGERAVKNRKCQKYLAKFYIGDF